MSLIVANFYDFDLYAETAKNWELDFRLLSKNDFSAYINMFTSLTFQITRTKLSGQIDQFGNTPQGFRTIVIPVNYDNQFTWLNKKVSGNTILIFPKDSVLDAVSHNNFDVHIVSIEESHLFKMLDDLGYKHAKSLFNGNEQHLHLSHSFAKHFQYIASQLLMEINNSNTQNALSFDIMYSLLKYMDKSDPNSSYSPQRKRDRALKEAISHIHNPHEVTPSIQKLCSLTSTSERTLEYAFLEKYQISPSAYIKAYRLNMVKKSIAGTRGQGIQISALAAKYDFWHMGQFAQDFKTQFGILPSEYLKR